MTLTYTIDAISGGELTLPWGDPTDGWPQILPLDDDYSLVYGLDSTQGYAIVVEHSNPAAMTTAAGYTDLFLGFVPDKAIARLSPDGTTIIVGGNRPGLGRWQSQTLNWTPGTTTLTDQGVQQHTEWATPTNLRPCLVLVSSTVLLATSGTDYTTFNYSSTGVGAVIHNGTHFDVSGPFRTPGDIWRIDNTHALVWGPNAFDAFGTGMTVVNVPGAGAISAASSVTFASLSLPAGYEPYGFTDQGGGVVLGIAQSGSPTPSQDRWGIVSAWNGTTLTLTKSLYHDGSDAQSVYAWQRYPISGGVGFGPSPELLTEYGNQGYVADPTSGYSNSQTTLDANAIGQVSPHLAYYPLRVMATPYQILVGVSDFSGPRIFVKAFEVTAHGYAVTGLVWGVIPLG